MISIKVDCICGVVFKKVAGSGLSFYDFHQFILLHITYLHSHPFPQVFYFHRECKIDGYIYIFIMQFQDHVAIALTLVSVCIICLRIHSFPDFIIMLAWSNLFVHKLYSNVTTDHREGC